MPQVRGVSADRVRRVSLLQGHEEVRRAWQDETVLHYEAVYRSKCACVTARSEISFLQLPLLVTRCGTENPKLSDMAFILSSIEGRCGGNQFTRNWHSNHTEILGFWGEERAGSSH